LLDCLFTFLECLFTFLECLFTFLECLFTFLECLFTFLEQEFEEAEPEAGSSEAEFITSLGPVQLAGYSIQKGMLLVTFTAEGGGGGPIPATNLSPGDAVALGLTADFKVLEDSSMKGLLSGHVYQMSKVMLTVALDKALETSEQNRFIGKQMRLVQVPDSVTYERNMAALRQLMLLSKLAQRAAARALDQPSLDLPAPTAVLAALFPSDHDLKQVGLLGLDEVITSAHKRCHPICYAAYVYCYARSTASTIMWKAVTTT
jgi:hypothetical protein